jgi:hypothetical protein
MNLSRKCVSGFVVTTGTLPMMVLWIAKKSGSACIKGVPMVSCRGSLSLPWGASKQIAIFLVDATARPLTMMEFVQSIVEGGGQWENLAVVRDAPNMPNIKVCVLSIVQIWNVAAVRVVSTRLWREEYSEIIGHLMRLVGSSDLLFFWHEVFCWISIITVRCVNIL